jgi:hypothetical protein
MKLIAHRGNLTGSNPIRENSIAYIEEAISEGFDVEIDLRVEDDQCYLGHDDPQYFITMEWLRKYKDVLWIHCKNREALEKLSTSMVEFNYFWHETDSYTLTSKGIGWVYPGKQPYSNSVVVIPETMDFCDEYIIGVYGICTDRVIYYKDFYGK